MITSATLSEITSALLAAQKELGGVKKGSSNPFFKSTYANFNAVLAEVKPVYSRHGLVIIQSPVSDGSMVGVTTRVLHESGEWIEGTITLPLAKSDPQSAGSAITYAKRYALQSMALLPSLDDDAEQSMFREPESVDVRQVEEITNLAALAGVEVSAICSGYKVMALADLPNTAYSGIVKTLKERASL